METEKRSPVHGVRARICGEQSGKGARPNAVPGFSGECGDVKILRFGTSQDAIDVPPEMRLDYMLARGIEAEIGEPVEMVMRRAWPTPRLASDLKQWMEEEEPDMVLMYVIEYWFTYNSVPLKLRRRFGRPGKALGQAGLNMAKKPRLAHNRVFQTGRKLATRIIGGETYYTPDQVIESLTACIKEAIRHESVIVHVTGPTGFVDLGDYSKKASAEFERRRLYVQDRIGEVCDQYHVRFRRYDRQVRLTGEAPNPGKDGLHVEADALKSWIPDTVAELVATIREARGVGAGR